MKRIIATMLAISMVFSFSACNDAEKERYDALSEQISKLTEQIGTLTGEITTLTSELESLKQSSGQSISDLEQKLQTQLDEMELMQKKIDNLTGVPIEFTEEAPVYGPREDSQRYFYSHFDGENSDPLGEFKNYILNDLAKNQPYDFLYFDRQEYELGYFDPHDCGRYCHYEVNALGKDENGTLISPMIQETISIYDEALGCALYEKYINGIEGGAAESLFFILYMPPFESEIKFRSTRITLKFGNNATNDRYRHNTYINIYYGEQCIATCTYKVGAYISKTWLEVLFAKNLKGTKSYD